MFWRHELTPEQAKEVDRIKAEFEADNEDYKLELRRESRKEIQAYKDKIAEMQSETNNLKTMQFKAAELFERDLELNKRDVIQDNREELQDQRSEHLDNVEEKRNEDYEYHHKLANEYQNEAKTAREAAKSELRDAKSETRQAGYNDGYAKGFESGITRIATSANEARTEANETAKLLALVTTSNRTIVADSDTDKQDPASKALAEAFAKHLTSTIDKLMTPKKETK